MCGIIALFKRPGPQAADGDNAVLIGRDAMTRRGPDGEGYWRDDGVAMGHRRLSIVDLDPRAAQPMISPCARYVIVFNGEIYNYQALRSELIEQGFSFSTTSDTEVILALFAAEGEAMLSRLQGMFAFAIWDRKTSRAFIARDAYGIKPMYIGMSQHGVWIGSQVSALVATGALSTAADPKGQAGFWMLGSVPEPHTWYRDIRALASGHCAWISEGRIVSERCWFDVGAVWRESRNDRIAQGEVRELVAGALRDSVSRHLIADVPVGVFLSGGIDSGALAALMVEAGARDLQGVTIAYDEFNGTSEDEVPVAKRIAEYYGINHHVRRIGKAEFLDDLPRILSAMDQPSIDGVNTWYAAKAAAEVGLKVVVSGVGGDELFLGYKHFRTLPGMVRKWRAAAAIPGVPWMANLAAGWQARRTGNARWFHAPDWAQTIEGAWWLRRSLHAPEDLSDVMGAEIAAEALENFDARRSVEAMSGALPKDYTLSLGQIESTTYMRNQLLRDGDWASMDHSVELRTPLVDSPLLSALAPVISQFPQFPGKRLLAEAPARPLPEDVILRRKTGFGIPTMEWLASRHPEGSWKGMRSWARELAAAYDSRA